MDTEHRHELKENDLAEFFRNFGQWWSKHGNATLVLVLILAVGFTGYRLLVARTSEQHESAWRDLANSTTPEAYRSVAELSADAVVRATAYLRGADLLLAKASQEPTADADGPEEPVERRLETAEQMFRQAIEVAKDEQLHGLFQLNALLGLASIHEARHEFEKAADCYQKVQQEAGPTNRLLAARAKAREAMLEKLAVPVTFAPEPIPQTPPASVGDQEPVEPVVSGQEPVSGQESVVSDQESVISDQESVISDQESVISDQ